MILKRLKVNNFRNYESTEIEFDDKINIIYGDNGQGKTNLLESIYFLGLLRSYRTSNEINMIKENNDFFMIKGLIQDEILQTKLEVTISKKNKKIKKDQNVIKKVSDYISLMNIIIFNPDDLEIIKGSPQERRQFLNTELSQLYSNYYDLLHNYHKILKIRNEIIKQDGLKKTFNKDYFDIVTDKLIDQAIYLYRIRNKFIDKLNSSAASIYEDLSNEEGFKIVYVNNINIDNFEKENIKKIMKNKFNEIYDQEIRYGTTLLGPHRDDFTIVKNEFNFKNHGSQGQQRMAVLAIKLAEISIFQHYSNNNPILLLDDVFSELDDNKKNNLLKYITNNIQTIITTTDLNNLDKKIICNSKLFNIKAGKIIEEVERNGKK